MGASNRSLVAIWAALGGLMLGSPAAAQAQQAYVTANTLNCRDAASTSSGPVTKLAYRDRVAVQTEEAGWSKVQASSGSSCWVSSRYLSSEEPASRSTTTSSSHSRPSSSRVRQFSSSGSTRARQSASTGSSRRSSARRSSRSQGLSGGSCPCSGSSVCIGPRGGRYCITSGGNKRYGVSGYIGRPSDFLLEKLRRKTV